MAAAGNLDWLFGLIGWVLIVTGTLAVAWALFWDRSRGRRRCPKCWYDMAGVPGLRCPECGRTATCETRLKKTRRRKRWAAAAVVVMLLGVGTTRVPSIRREGWTSVVPTSALVFLAPLDVPLAALLANVRVAPMAQGSLSPGAYTGLAPIAITMPPPPWRPTLGERLVSEVWSRLASGRMWQWQEGVFTARWLRAHPEFRVSAALTLPPRWPINHPIPIIISPRSGTGVAMGVRVHGGPWQTGFTDWTLNNGEGGTALPGESAEQLAAPVDVGVNVGGTFMCTERAAAFIDLVGSPKEVLAQDATPAANALVLAALRPRLVRVGADIGVEFDDRSNEARWKAADFGVFFVIDLRVAGRTVATGHCFADWWRPVSRHNEWVKLSRTWGGPGIDAAQGDDAELVIRGSSEYAWGAYSDRPWVLTRPACWTGQLVVPVGTIENMVKTTPDNRPAGGPG